MTLVERVDAGKHERVWRVNPPMVEMSCLCGFGRWAAEDVTVPSAEESALAAHLAEFKVIDMWPFYNQKSLLAASRCLDVLGRWLPAPRERRAEVRWSRW